jgi:23S rRNA pseudouridine2605 synthase
MPYRINQYLAKHLPLSRRSAEKYITQGLVKINGKQAALNTLVEEKDTVEVFFQQNWKKLAYSDNKENQTILFYKPPFAITGKKRDSDKKTIYNYLPKIYHSLNPAGRLDYLSEGLLILSNDGLLINELTHPKFGHTKTYLVNIDKRFSEKERKSLERGVILDNYKLRPIQITLTSNTMLKKYSFLKLNPKGYWYFFALSEGRNNQIRKMCKLVDKKVYRLIRIRQGKYELSPKLFKNGIIEAVSTHIVSSTND